MKMENVNNNSTDEDEDEDGGCGTDHGESVKAVANTGGKGLWKQVFTCWEHCRLWQNVPPIFPPDTFHSHFNVTSTFASNVITNNISFTFQM